MLSRPTNSATAEEELTGRLRQDRVARRMASKPKCHETMTAMTTPFLIVEHVAQMRALYDTAIALTVKFEDIPRVAPCDRIELASLAEGFWNITVHFSSSRRPTFPPPKDRGCPLDIGNAVYFGARDAVIC